MTWPRPSFIELIQQFPEPLFIRMLEVGCDGGRCDARLDRDQVRSMPTSETRADASMTMPLSRTRSSTSISDARKMPRVFRHLVRNNYKRFDRNMWLRICRNYARGAHCQHYNPGTGAEGSSPPKHKRSEEHTSELQSHSDIVCRLLLEKKKTTTSETEQENSPIFVDGNTTSDVKATPHYHALRL